MDKYLDKIIGENSLLNRNMIITKADSGFTNTVYILDNKYVIKICTNKNNKERFNKEIKFYSDNKNNKYIPKLYSYYISEDDYSYEIIEKVEGVTLYNVWHTFSHEKRNKILKEIVNMMKSIHQNKGKSYNFALYIKNKLNSDITNIYNIFNPKELNIFSKIINNLDKYFNTNDFRLIHGDLHFDNILIDQNNNIKVIDFETSLYAPIDYELDIFLRMCNNPFKYATLEEEKYINKEDYKNIPKYLKENYPEIFEFKYFEIRHLIYDLEANLRLLSRFKEDTELKNVVINIMYQLDILIK